MTKQKQYIFNGPKFFTESRKKLTELDLPASAAASYVLAHFLCDADTGVFTRDDSGMERMSGIPRQTIYEGFKPLLESGLVIQTGSVYAIAEYESLRNQTESYFRIPPQFIQVISKCVRHRLPNVISFGLQLLDQLRNAGASPSYSIHSLKRYLGLIPCRIHRKLIFLSEVIQFEVRSGVDGDVFTFSPVVDTLASEEQVKDRNIRGSLTKHLKTGLDRGKRTFGAAADISSRFVNSVVRFLSKYHQALDGNVLTELTEVVGLKIVEKQAGGDRIRYPAAYLKASVNDLLAQIHPGVQLEPLPF